MTEEIRTGGDGRPASVLRLAPAEPGAQKDVENPELAQAINAVTKFVTGKIDKLLHTEGVRRRFYESGRIIMSTYPADTDGPANLVEVSSPIETMREDLAPELPEGFTPQQLLELIVQKITRVLLVDAELSNADAMDLMVTISDKANADHHTATKQEFQRGIATIPGFPKVKKGKRS